VPKGSLDAELVALRAGRNDVAGAGFLDLPEYRAQFVQSGDFGVAVFRAGVQVQVHAVLARLGLGDLLEEKAAAQPVPVISRTGSSGCLTACGPRNAGRPDTVVVMLWSICPAASNCSMRALLSSTA
jgi:hypothetical protein